MDEPNLRGVMIISHYTGQVGGLNTLIRYIHERGQSLQVLLHPLDDYSTLSTGLYTQNYQRVKEIKRSNKFGALNLVIDFCLSLRFIILSHGTHTFIGASNFDTLPAIFARKILRKKISRILYYPRDYSPKRFNNKVLNFIYEMIEAVCVRASDSTISNSNRAESQRIAKGLKKHKSLVIPNPVLVENPQFKPKNIQKRNFIYVGDVSEEHGLMDLIDNMSPLIDKLVIIGSGPAWEKTIDHARRHSFTLEVHNEKTHEFTTDYLNHFDGFGIAPYNTKSQWTYYCSPLKVGEYICAGLPVLMSSVPEVSILIRNENLGVVYDTYNLDFLSQEISELNTRDFHRKAKKFYEQHNYQVLYGALGI